MTKRLHRFNFFLMCGVLAFLCAGCTSLMEKTGRAIDGSAFAEKTVAVYRTEKNVSPVMEIRKVQNKAGEHSVIITIEEYPTIKLRGSLPDENGEFNLLALDYLGGSANGWNEYRLEINGAGNMTLDENEAVFSVYPDVEAGQIAWGRIRRFDNRLTGDEALTSLRNRRERIIVLAEWMNDFETPAEHNAPVEDDAPANPASNIEEFENYWKPFLFPEIVSKKEQPAGWRQEGDQWRRAEDIRWNTDYTERVFPELLWDVRNSGTMLRDWEEAVEWLYVEYEWERIVGLFSQEIVLTKTKK